MKTKISIVGAGNAGCVSALNLHYLNITEEYDIDEIEILYDPNVPIERVGQGTQLNVCETIFEVLNVDWVENNPIKATMKQGIRYKNWGKKTDNFFHSFSSGAVATHYIPKLFSETVLNSGLFNVVEKTITDPEKEIDSTYIIDCRGRPDKLDDSYDRLTNPLNSVILAKKDGPDPSLLWTDHIATPNGWTFVIPNHDSVSYGYMYNDTVTTKEEAEKDFVERFDVEPNGYLSFDNYVAKDVWRGERTILNGNLYAFIEPMEASSSEIHHNISESLYDVMLGEKTKEEANKVLNNEMHEVSDFILWHYKHGSKYDTPFWNYAQSLPYHNESTITEYIERCINAPSLIGEDLSESYQYAHWEPRSYKIWNDKVGGI
tara:strand:- start:1774 stop:2898 length:1125 start_codon:yes stop_codon:yes gene_type:complete